jgi:peptidoglycan hydrolase-like protein with peptidoglycan-binding domain
MTEHDNKRSRPLSATTESDTRRGVAEPADRDPTSATSLRRRWPWIAVVLLLVAAGIAVVAAWGGNPTAEAVDTSPANFAEVVSTDLFEVESYDATLGTVAGDPVKTQRAGTVTWALEAGSTATAGDVVYTVDGEPVVLLYGATPAWRDLAPTDDATAVVNRLNGTVTDVVEAGTVLREGDIAYWVNGEPVVVLYGDTPAYRTMNDARTNLEGEDILQLEQYLDAAGYDDVGIGVDGEFTSGTAAVVENWQEDIGAAVDGVVGLGEILFVDGPLEVRTVDVAIGDTVNDGRPVLTIEGSTATTGDDVLQLESNLAAFGYDADGRLAVDGVFDEATTEAIVAWQSELGVEVDGVVDLGEIVFVPSAIRVADQIASPGTAVNPGTSILAVSSAEKVVTLDLPAEDQDLLAVGDRVVVELPDGTDTSATVTEIATVATVNQQGNAVFEVTIVLEDPAVATGLDEAPVDVEIVTDSAVDVIAVPVTALVALSEGGYAVEVESGTGTQLVAVDPGFFADGMVEVTSNELAPGDRVVVP